MALTSAYEMWIWIWSNQRDGRVDGKNVDLDRKNTLILGQNSPALLARFSVQAPNNRDNKLHKPRWRVKKEPAAMHTSFRFQFLFGYSYPYLYSYDPIWIRMSPGPRLAIILSLKEREQNPPIVWTPVFPFYLFKRTNQNQLYSEIHLWPAGFTLHFNFTYMGVGEYLHLSPSTG